MPELDLPRGPRELFQAVYGPLAQAFGGEEHIRLGGGTALAARWAHRHSVDLDFFVEPEPYRRFHWNTGGRFVLDITAAAPVDRLAIERDDTYLSFRGLDGHISINPGSLTPEPLSRDIVSGTGLPFETTNEILAKKLVFRMARDRRIISEDLYDIAWARRHDAVALDQALRAVHRQELTNILVALDDHVASGRELAPLLDPADRQLQEGAPASVRRLLHDRLRHRAPGSEPTPGPTSGR